MSKPLGCRARRSPLALLIFISALASAAAPVRAEPDAAVARTAWSQALDRASERLGLDDQIAAAGVQADALARTADGWFAGPFEAEASVRGDSIGSGVGYGEAETAVTVPLWRRGERALWRSRAEAGGAAARAAREALRLEAAGLLRERWWARARAEATAAEDTRQARLSAELAAQVARLVAGGEMARLDQRQADVAAADAAARAARSAAEAEAARAAFAALVGDDPVVLPEEPPGDAPAVHPLLALAEGEAAALRARGALAGVAAGPRWRVGVDVRAERGMRGDDREVSTGLRVARALGPDRAALADAASLGAEVARAETALRRTRFEVETAIAQARSRLAAAEAAQAQAQVGQAAASEALALTERGRREGELSFVEELRARAVAGEAARGLALARIAVAAARSDIHQAQGLVP